MLQRLFEISKLDRGDVREIVVPLRRIVVEPFDHVVDLGEVDDHRRFSPHDIDRLDRAAGSAAW